MNILKPIWKAFDIALGMSGLRLDAGRYLFAWIPLLCVSVWLGYQAERSGWIVEYAISTWVFYYIGISLILGTRIKSVMLEKFGENNATKWGYFAGLKHHVHPDAIAEATLVHI